MPIIRGLTTKQPGGCGQQTSWIPRCPDPNVYHRGLGLDCYCGCCWVVAIIIIGLMTGVLLPFASQPIKKFIKPIRILFLSQSDPTNIMQGENQKNRTIQTVAMFRNREGDAISPPSPTPPVLAVYPETCLRHQFRVGWELNEGTLTLCGCDLGTTVATQTRTRKRSSPFSPASGGRKKKSWNKEENGNDEEPYRRSQANQIMGLSDVIYSTYQ